MPFLGTTPEKRTEVLKLLAEGAGHTEVARRVGLGRATIYRIQEEAKEAGQQVPPTSDNGAGGLPPIDTPVAAAPGAPAPAPKAKPAPTRPAAPGRVNGASRAEEAQLLYYVPKAFSMNTQLVFAAQQAVEQRWGWPHMQPGQFIDTFLYVMLKVKGIQVAPYVDFSDAPAEGWRVAQEPDPAAEGEVEIIDVDAELAPENEEAEDAEETKEPADKEPVLAGNVPPAPPANTAPTAEEMT